MERGAQDWLDQVVGHLDAPMTPDTPLRMAANGILDRKSTRLNSSHS